MTIRKPALLTIGLAAAIACGGCHPQPGASAQPGAGNPPGTAWAGPKLPPPPGVDPAALQPRQGPALTRARMTLAEALDTLPLPPYLAAATQGPATQPGARRAPAEPPIEAQRAYVEGRLAWREHRNNEAIEYLQQADRLAPNSADVLRLLGEVYATISNRMKAASYFEQAAALDTGDPESLFVLGRFALDRNDGATAIVDFARALAMRGHASDADADAGLWSFTAFALGGALERAGFDMAAIAQYRDSLEAPPAEAQTTHMVRELMFLARRRGNIWMAIGDAENRLNDPVAAMAAYRQIGDQPVDDPAALWSRLAYTHLRLGQRDLAEDLAVAAVRDGKAGPVTVEIARYVAAEGGRRQVLISRLTQAYQELGRPGTLAVAIAGLMGPGQGQAFLEAHLAARPDDAGVGEQLIRQTLGQSPRTTAALTGAVRAAVSSINAAPRWAHLYSEIILNSNSPGDDLRAALAALSPAEQASPGGHYVTGRILRSLGDLGGALAAFEAAGTGSAAMGPARIELAQLLLECGQTARAAEALKPLSGNADPLSVALRCEVALQSDGNNAAADALKIIDDQLGVPQPNLDLVLLKSRLQFRLGDSLGAESTLQDALESHPQNEAIYDHLFDLYEDLLLHERRPGPAPDAMQQYQRLLQRAFSQIPQSHVARRQSADLLSTEHNDQAEKILRDLIAEDPTDYRSLEMLKDLLLNTRRPGDARALIEEALAKAPRDPGVLITAFRFYLLSTDDKDRWLDAYARFMNLDSYMRFMLLDDSRVWDQLFMLEGDPLPKRLATVYLAQHRATDAVRTLTPLWAGKLERESAVAEPLMWALLDANQAQEAQHVYDDAVKRYPGDEAELASAWGAQLDRHGLHDRAVEVEREAVKKFPKDADLDNALGYSLADQGKSLAEAKGLLTKAVEAQPQTSAFLDSLGWTYYKLGQFHDAVEWLDKAHHARFGEHPVILGHLGDAQYRAGDANLARQAWQQGLGLAKDNLILKLTSWLDEDTELSASAAHLTQRLEALDNHKTPPVAPVPGMGPPPPPPQSAAPPNRPPGRRFMHPANALPLPAPVAPGNAP